MKLNPLADRVILKQNAAEEKTAGGILLTQSSCNSLNSLFTTHNQIVLLYVLEGIGIKGILLNDY